MRAIALVRYTRGPGEVHQGQSDPKVTQVRTAGTGAEDRPRLRDSRLGPSLLLHLTPSPFGQESHCPGEVHQVPW